MGPFPTIVAVRWVAAACSLHSKLISAVRPHSWPLPCASALVARTLTCPSTFPPQAHRCAAEPRFHEILSPCLRVSVALPPLRAEGLVHMVIAIETLTQLEETTIDRLLERSLDLIIVDIV